MVTRFPGQLGGERRKHVVESPGQNDVVVAIEEKDDETGGQTDACVRENIFHHYRLCNINKFNWKTIKLKSNPTPLWKKCLFLFTTIAKVISIILIKIEKKDDEAEDQKMLVSDKIVYHYRHYNINYFNWKWGKRAMKQEAKPMPAQNEFFYHFCHYC